MLKAISIPKSALIQRFTSKCQCAQFPIIVIQLKFNQKLCHLPRHAPQAPHRTPLHATPKIKDDKSEGKVMEIAAIICQRQRPQSTHKHTHKRYSHTHAQLAGRCSLGLLCASKIVTKITERQAKKSRRRNSRKKIIFTFTMTMSLCLRPPCHAPS